ncbi:MAG: hypothetical protein CH6_1965 [Candidatus Kapaibacterium sp.]|nr:MAG: hypothetical protein CH6_1965 [Candidatus Kapabacteria bacterium]
MCYIKNIIIPQTPQELAGFFYFTLIQEFLPIHYNEKKFDIWKKLHSH